MINNTVKKYDTDRDKKAVSPHISLYCHMDSPVGPLMLAGCDKALRLVNFPKGSQAREPHASWREDKIRFSREISELDAYFRGDLHTFAMPILLEGSPFQTSVWAALRTIEFGHVASYGDIAKKLNKPGAARAVGGANNANPVPIIVPCHRIIGANKSLTGFGGGIATKKFLLDHEALHARIEGRLL
jgi:methylated-DNA-[protein]-cysteine S-methyltransferase